MAPEQAANRYKEIGVATDVYGLGAILHELLTGEPPFVGESNGEVLKRIQEEDLSPARLRSRRVPRDLETICLKCLEKEPTRRYQSARDLADDLCRFLDGRPVLARPIRLPARLARWSQRRPVVAGLASALIVAVAAGTTTALWQWYRAEQYLVEARAAAASAQRNLEQSQHALFDLAWIVEESNARRDPDDRIPNPFHKKLEEYRAAGWLQPTAPLAVKPLLAVSHSFAAHDAAAAGNTQAAINHYNQALEYWCQVTAAKWSHERGGYDRGFALCLLSAARHRCRLDAESDDPLRGARELITQVSRDYRVTPFSYIGFVSTAKELAYLHMEDRRWREAVEHFELARLALEVLIAWVPHDRARFEHWMASLCREIASMHRKLGNGEAVAEHLNRAIAAAQQSLLVKPDELLYEHELALDLRALGSFYRERRNLPAAQETLEQGVSTMTGVFERHRESPAYAIDLAKVTRELALVLQARGRRKEALAAFVRSREAWTEASSRADPSVADRQMHAKVCHQAGTLALELDQPDLARRAFADGVAAYSKLTMSTLKHNEQFEHAECHYFLARHSESVGDKPAAIEHYERAVELLKDQASKRDANLAIKDRYRRSVAALEELRKAQPAGQPVSGGP
jgi:tetratricopeptide (TPR) repeat protein